MMSKFAGVFFSLLVSISAASLAQWQFHGLGHLPGGNYSYAQCVSADGTVVAGYSTSGVLAGESFTWTLSGGMQPLRDSDGIRFSSSPAAISADGSIIAGALYNDGIAEAYLWSESEGLTRLGNIAGGDYPSWAFGLTPNGSTVVGFSEFSGGWEGFKWTASEGMAGMGDLPGGEYFSRAFGISADGSVIAGYSVSDEGYTAVRWTPEGLEALGDLPGGEYYSHGGEISADGSTIGGVSKSANSGTNFEAFRWTQEEGMIGLGDLEGGDFHSEIRDVSADGSIITGFGHTEKGMEAVIWDENGIHHFQQFMENEGLILDGWQLSSVQKISDNGLTYVGMGINPDGLMEAWVITAVPEPASILLVGFNVLLIRKRRA